ncbi:MAG: transcription termination factor Rho [Candidatus Marinimicrobia bacterium]|nr:transcription termination factor Rho [Candidatus Neomarinimicrobiota bacterium]MCF7828261.1 transcription termination factor Rho [Candidatus Neomarinimicrobiota bacterium]MCF7879564.1 transcription termination factor Rho [Candidatus Neomarinimicrobiota bacterium]
MEDRGYGFIRKKSLDWRRTNDDIFVAPNIILDNELRQGCLVAGDTEPGRESGLQVKSVSGVNGVSVSKWKQITRFGNGVPISPVEKFQLERHGGDKTGRIIDAVAPIGKGQRSLIVAPPRGGKTVLLKNIAQSLEKNHKESHLIVLLVDERPEEVTDMVRSVKGEVFASSKDQNAQNHLRTAELTLDYAKRRVEMGDDVVMLVDSLTRLGRAANANQKSSGRTMTGGIDIRAMEFPRALFGAARKIEDEGSLTIAATALVETNSRMDDYIFEEFKGTGNMELVLDRTLAEQRIYPAVNILESGTRQEEKLFGKMTSAHQRLRRELSRYSAREALETLLNLIEKTSSNDEMLRQFDRRAKVS